MNIATPEQVRWISSVASQLRLPFSVIAHRNGLSLPMKMSDEPEMDLEDLSKPSGHTYVATVNKEHLWQWMRVHDKATVDDIRQEFWSGHGADGNGLGIAPEVAEAKKSIEHGCCLDREILGITKAWIVWRNDNLHDLIEDAWDSDNGQVDGTMKLAGYLKELLKGQ